MASHYRDVGYGSNENVITGSAEAVQGESCPTQTNVPLQFNLLCLRDDESWNPAERAHGDGRVNEPLSRCQSACLQQPYTLPTVLLSSHNHFKSES